MVTEPPFMLCAGTSHQVLAQKIAECLRVQLGKVVIETFPDGEIGARILESVRGRDVFVLQTIARQPNFYLMELLILVDALKRASARSVTAVIPYFGYSRQDRRGSERVAISAKLVANLLETAGVNRVLTMDLHTEQLQGFFDIPVDNLYARPVLIEELHKLKLDACVVVTPDIGSIKLVRRFTESLKADMAIVDKRRLSAKHVEVYALLGDVKGRDVLLVDDMCSTGETLKTAADVCQKAGAKRIFAAVTHGFLLTSAFEESAIEKMFITDSIPLLGQKSSRVEVVSVAALFGKAIESIVDAKSISSLY